MNVLVGGRVPRVIGLAEALKRMARAPARRAVAPFALSVEPDRTPARSSRRLPRRLPQPRQGHQNHSKRGRAEAGIDEDVQAVGRPGRRHSEYAAAQFAQARGNGDPRGRQEAAHGKEVDRGFVALREGAMEDHRRRNPRGAREFRGEDAARQAPHRLSPRRRHTTRPRSRRRWSNASRSPSWFPRRAGSGRCAARSPICRAWCSRPTMRSRSHSSPRPHQSFWSSPPMVAATPLRRRSCPAGAATASRSGCSSSSSRKAISSPFPSRRRAQVSRRQQAGQGLYCCGGRVRGQHAQGQADPQRQAAR